MILMSAQTSQAIMVLITCAVVTFALRASSFILFKNKEMPSYLKYLGYTLPLVMMPTLVVYGVSSVKWLVFGEAFAAIAGIIGTALIHWWKKNTILSLVFGTAIYMLLLYIC